MLVKEKKVKSEKYIYLLNSMSIILLRNIIRHFPVSYSRKESKIRVQAKIPHYHKTRLSGKFEPKLSSSHNIYWLNL